MTVVTLGEAMIAMVPLAAGPLRHVATYEKRIGGAELNTAIGLSRLGTAARWISRVGDDEFGADIIRNARADGVDTSCVRVDAEAPTAVYFREYGGPGGIRVYYYRRGSAASRLAPADIDAACFTGARLFHVTGITPALSQSCREACQRAVGLAGAAGARVSFDPNIRRKLIAPGDAPALLLPLAEAADVLLAGEEELLELFGSKSPHRAAPGRGGSAPSQGAAAAQGDAPADLLERLVPLLERARASGPRVVVCKLGAAGAVVLSDAGLVFQPALPVAEVVDPIGAGDGFNAGFLHVWLRGGEVADALRWGAVVGACAVAVRGDVEGYPDAARATALVARLAAVPAPDVER